MASLFHQHDALVVIADIQDELGQALAAKLGQQASYAHCDVSIKANVRDLMDAGVANHGRLDFMYNNSGVLNRPLRASSTHLSPTSTASSASTSTGPSMRQATRHGHGAATLGLRPCLVQHLECSFGL
ncbi:tropinone reductase-like 1 [Eucalyptus grandis]|uniref:tropinone reductase-like 1 n=1 Tax=Eucalyptus grandis TaxID=71139 RepID=UPI00192EE278|nr:tropinone reductase-like 1 [Eucalyptus grandis]